MNTAVKCVCYIHQECFITTNIQGHIAHITETEKILFHTFSKNFDLPNPIYSYTVEITKLILTTVNRASKVYNTLARCLVDAAPLKNIVSVPF